MNATSRIGGTTKMSKSVITEVLEGVEAVLAAWDRDNAARHYSATDEQKDARIALAESLGRLKSCARQLRDERVAIASDILSICEELSQPVYNEEREFSDFQLKQHLYGSDNSQG